MDPPLFARPTEVVERAPGVLDGAARVARRGAVGAHDARDRLVPPVLVANRGGDGVVPAALRPVPLTAERGDATLPGEQHRELVPVGRIGDPLEAGDALGERGVGRGELAGVEVDEGEVHGRDADHPVVLAPPGSGQRLARHELGEPKVPFRVRAEREVRERHAFHRALTVEQLAGPAPPVRGGRDLPLADVLESLEEAGVAVPDPVAGACERLPGVAQLVATTRPVDRADRDAAEQAGPRVVGEVERGATGARRERAGGRGPTRSGRSRRHRAAPAVPRRRRARPGACDQPVDDGCPVLGVVHCLPPADHVGRAGDPR